MKPIENVNGDPIAALLMARMSYVLKKLSINITKPRFVNTITRLASALMLTGVSTSISKATKSTKICWIVVKRKLEAEWIQMRAFGKYLIIAK